MGLTNIDQVLLHLNRLNLGDREISGQAVHMVSSEYVYLSHTHIETQSETVKALSSDIPASDTATMNSVPAQLLHTGIVPGSLVCSSDSSLSIIYQENVDFTVAYRTGSIVRCADGSIPEGKKVSIWYLFYRIYQREIDYQIDYDRGSLKRLVSGQIEEGQEVLVDYRLGETQFSNGEIEQAIDEAEAEIRMIIHTDFAESTDPALQTAATSLALSILCRNAAGMVFPNSVYSGKTSAVWLELSDSYRRTALRLLTWFRKGSPELRRPRLG